MIVWNRLDRWLGEGTRACLVTVLSVEGSSPREVGARMLVRADGGCSGTIGGGALEWQVLALAQRLLDNHPEGHGAIRSFSLGPDLGQCCGGRIKVLVEAFGDDDRGWIASLGEVEALGRFITTGRVDDRGIFLRSPTDLDPRSPGTIALKQFMLHEVHGETRTHLLLFGAGHVGRALVMALAPLPFSVRWVDPRPDAFPAHFPGNVTPVVSTNPVAEIGAAQPGTQLLAMTHSHALDLDLMAAALTNPAISFVGVIGSRTKRARFASRLGVLGLSDTLIARMACPIGLPVLTGKEPATIAAGVAVQLLEAHEKALADAPHYERLRDPTHVPRDGLRKTRLP